MGLLTLAILAAGACARAGPQRADLPAALVGRWLHAGTPFEIPNRIILDLYEDGTYSLVTALSAIAEYDLDGELLTISPRTTPVRGTVRFDGDTLVKTLGGETQRFVRASAFPTGTGITGVWVSWTLSGMDYYEQYTDTGILRMERTMSREVGRYSVAANRLSFTTQLPETSSRSARFSLRDSQLSLSGFPRGSSRTYLRVN